jgi:hypothetical protein
MHQKNNHDAKIEANKNLEYIFRTKKQREEKNQELHWVIEQDLKTVKERRNKSEMCTLNRRAGYDKPKRRCVSCQIRIKTSQSHVAKIKQGF